MILVLGHPDDPLIREVRRRFSTAGEPALCLGETELFTATSLIFEQSRNGCSGFLRAGDTSVRLDEVSGVLMRLPRLWWPSADFDLQDQMFVYHECSAAWFAALNSLCCPVVNRFDLAWWLSDVTYPAALAHDLARQLEVQARIDPLPDPLPPRILPLPPGAGATSLYLAGQAIIPRDSAESAATGWLQQHARNLPRWQRENGTHLCRVDLGREGEDFFLRHVEIFPLLDGEPAALVSRIADAAVEMLA